MVISRTPGARQALPFPRARLYPGGDRATQVGRVRDPLSSFAVEPPASERLLQAVWYDPDLRPGELRTLGGEAVHVESPGTWNLGPGPDFLDAVLSLGPARRRVCGDVEVHVRPSDWTAHGHAADPRYRGVRFHVTFAPSPPPNAPLPPGAIRIALRESLARIPAFSFENIDPAAYPFAVRQAPCPCADALAEWTPDARGRLLDAAGEERLRRKAERFRRAADDQGLEQALYEEAMAALGYRLNKAAFRRLSVAVPAVSLREEAEGSPRTAYALLAGVAGLLPDNPKPGWDPETHAELRAAWDAWWKRRRRWSNACLPAGTWHLGGVRPANHPVRRLQAAAHWFVRPIPLHTALLNASRHPATGIRSILAWLDAPPTGYWGRRLTWGGRRHDVPLALVGRARAAAVFTNVAVPFLAAFGPEGAVPLPWLDTLPAESNNELIRRAAHALFGPDHSTTLYRSGLRRQGLLQIFHDYCLPDRSACADCPLTSFLRRHREYFDRGKAGSAT